MRTLFRLLTLLLCFELVVSPIQPSLSMFVPEALAQQSCAAGMQFDSILNRCLTKDETTKVMNATASCNGDRECYMNNAKRAFMENGSAPDRKKDSFISKIGTIAAVAGPVTYAAMGLSSSASSCLSPSFWAMVAGAAALVVGDNLANMQHRKRLKQIKEDWGKIVNPEDAKGDKDKERETSIEAQSEAFEKLAQAEDSLVKAAKMKQMFFMVATVAYGASVVMALMEKSESAAATAAASGTAAASAVSAGTSAAINPVAANQAAIAAAIKASSAEIAVTKESIDAASAKAAAIPAPAPAAGAATAASGASSQSASGMALAAKTKAAALAAEAAANVTAAKAALAAAEKLAASGVPATAALGAAQVGPAATALANAVAAQQAANTLTAEMNKNLCNAMGVTAYSPQAKPTSLYSYYIDGIKPDIKQELQATYNLHHSEDLASFIMNKKALDGHSPTYDEYASYKVEMEIEKSTFEIFKAMSLTVLNQLNPVSSVHAQEVDTNAADAWKDDKGKGLDLMTIGVGVAIGYALTFATGLREKLLTPTGRAVFSGVMAGMTLLMANHAKSQAEASTKRAELLRKMRDEFRSASGAINACKSEDREDPAKPNCYCYTPENGRNPNRTSSTICKNLWAGVNLKPTNYGSTATSSKVCVAKNGQADTACKCKTNNSCMKVGISNLKGLDVGSMSVLGSTLAPVNGVLNGSVDAANLDAASLANQAARMSDLAKKIENSKGFESYKKNKDKMTGKLLADLKKGSSALPAGSMIGGSGGSSMPSNPGEAARMLEKEIESANEPTSIGTNDFIATPSNNVPAENFEFGLSDDAAAIQDAQLAEVMKEDLDYGGNDTNPDAKANIFEVLSHRYQRSAMKRLFDEPAAPSATAPAPNTVQK